MEITYPHTIENCIGEKLIFKSLEGDKVIVENFVQPGKGPVMHTHFLQDEELTVIKGKIGYQVLGGEAKFAGPGESVRFNRGTPHRFWNAGEEVLNCTGWVQPANSIVFYLSAVYAAMNKSGTERPEAFDGAYLVTRYASEYDLPEMPGFVKKVVMPLTYRIGVAMGKYKHFAKAPEPLRR
jgi:quercetin dioxygenase-like cupin family protein